MNTLTAITTAFIFGSIATGHAQLAAAIDQVDTVQQRRQMDESMKTLTGDESAPELYPNESSDVGPQSVLKIKLRPTHFEAQADVQYFHTDNMFLVENNEQDADVLVSTVQFALAPTPYELGNGFFAPRLGYRHQWFNFGLSGKELDGTGIDLDEFDFNAQTVFIDGRWSRGNWILEAGVDYTRLMDSSDYEDFYEEIVPRWGVQRLFPLCENSVLSLGYAGDYRFTDIDQPFLPSGLYDRTDHSVFAAVSHTLCPYAVVQPFYRFKYTHFTDDVVDRDDMLHTFGLALHCPITRQVTLRAFAGYDLLESDDPSMPDYRKFDVGGGVNLTVRF